MKIVMVAAITLTLGTPAFASDKLESKAMSDKDMDKVTAGRVFPSTQSGIYTAGSIVSPQQGVQGTTHGCGICNRP